MLRIETFHTYSFLDKYKDDFFSLFNTVFNRPYTELEWERFYSRNPGGDPSGVLVLSDGILVAFSALLPGWIEVGGSSVPYGLYVAAMVHPDYRSGGAIYIRMLSSLKSVASDVGHAFVMAFPNRNAFCPLQQLGRFTLLDAADFEQGPIDGTYVRYLERMRTAPFLTERILKWRLGFPGLYTRDSVVIKEFQGRKNILDWLGDPAPLSDVEYDYPRWASVDNTNPGNAPRDVNLAYLEIESGSLDIASLRRSVLYSDVY